MEKNDEEVSAYLAVVHGGCADERETSEAAIMATAVAFCVEREREREREGEIVKFYSLTSQSVKLTFTPAPWLQCDLGYLLVATLTDCVPSPSTLTNKLMPIHLLEVF